MQVARASFSSLIHRLDPLEDEIPAEGWRVSVLVKLRPLNKLTEAPLCRQPSAETGLGVISVNKELSLSAQLNTEWVYPTAAASSPSSCCSSSISHAVVCF